MKDPDMNRTALRVVTAIAAVSLAAAAPLTAGVAAADDRPTDPRAWGISSSLAANTALIAAVQDARDAYRTAVLSAKVAFRTATEGARLEIQADTLSARDAAKAAGEAYRAVAEGRATGDLDKLRTAYTDALTAYRTALAAARTAYQGQFDTAMGSAKATLAMARTRYTSAIAAAFDQYANGVAVPRGLLDPGWWQGVPDSAWLGGERSRS